MQEYAFQVKLVAVVRVRAADEALARKVVPQFSARQVLSKSR
jgi:hypothetical protein